MELLPKWVLNDNTPAIHECESATAITMVAKLYGKVNELVTEYNKFVDSCNKTITDFVNGADNDHETFKVAIRQEFQDFIDVINLKVMNQDNTIADAVDYMKNNIIRTAQTVVISALSNKEIYVKSDYNPETEELVIYFGGED